MIWHHLLPLAVFLVAFISSVMSGMAGGGGSFIIMPFYILIGLTPQQAVATGKLGGLGLAIGAVAAFRERMLERKRMSIIVMVLTTIISLIASYFLTKVNNNHLQFFMGLMMLAMVPFMIWKNGRLHASEGSILLRGFGWFLLTVVLSLQALLSSGVGALVSAIFMIFFGLSALEANAMKRKTSLVLTTIMPLALIGSGLINVTYALCGVAGGLSGGYIGSRFAVKKGDDFARYALIILVVVSGTWLMLSA